MKDVKAFENAVASARVHLHNCGPTGEGETACFTCASSRALVDAHVALEAYKINGNLLTRCDLRHVFVNKFRVEGGCPYCHQLMNREAYIEWLRKQVDDLGDYTGDILKEVGFRKFTDAILNEPRPKGQVAPKLQLVAKKLYELYLRTSDPALKKHLHDEILEPLRDACAGVQP